MLASATPSFFFAASMIVVAHLWNALRVLLVAADAGDDDEMGVLGGGSAQHATSEPERTARSRERHDVRTFSIAPRPDPDAN